MSAGTDGPDWGERIRAARKAKDDAEAVYEQTVRDAHAGGRSAAQIARDLDRKDRTVITRILNARPEERVTPPGLPVVIYLRARMNLRERLEEAMHRRGWMTVGNAQEAWYLSRAGARCVHVDAFAVGAERLLVELRQAVEAQPAEGQRCFVSELLPASASVALERAFPGASDYRVPVQTVPRKWKRLAGGESRLPRRYDEEAMNSAGQRGAFVVDEQVVARRVADLLE